MITAHKDVQEFLEELNEIDETIIFGGYIRSRYFNEIPNDVDIVTNIPIEVLEERYSQMEKAQRRVTTSGHDVFSFKLHRTEKIFVEIVSIKSSIYDKAKQADYTINGLLYDGKRVIDIVGGFEDIKNKIIKEVDAKVIESDLSTRPFLWLKTLRLISMTGFDLSNETFKVLNDNKDCVKNISNEIMQTEGHKTLNGRNPFKVMKLLNAMNFISDFEVNNFEEKEYSIQPQQQLCLLAVFSNKQVIDDFCHFYKFQQDLIDKYHKLYDFYYSSERVPSRFKNQIITIKKLAGEWRDNK